MNSWCESCAKKSQCYTAEIRPKCYVATTNTDTDGYACLKKVGAKAEQTEPSLDPNLIEPKEYECVAVIGTEPKQTEFVSTILDTDYDDNRNGYAIVIGGKAEQTERSE